MKVWEDYENGKMYQAQLGITNQIPQNIDFYEGRQWGNTRNLELTKNYPRPVINIIKMICRNKKALVLSSDAKLVYKSFNSDGAREFTEFASYIYKEAHVKKLNDSAISDAVKKGTYIYHWFWDSDVDRANGEFKGGLRGEILDPLNVIFANPKQTDVQKQKWIIIATREDVETVRKLIKSNKLDTEIYEDDEFMQETVQDSETTELCTVLTKYFKNDREVFVEKWVKGGLVQKAVSLTPLQQKEVPNEDGERLGLPQEIKRQEPYKDEIKFSLYPIVVGNWEERENSIYGLSEVEDLIPNQKVINTSEAIKVLVGQSQSSSKIIAREGALGKEGQKISSDPLQIIKDYTPKEYGNGFYNLPAGQVSPILAQITDSLIQNTRIVSGSTEVMSGEVISRNMSGEAILALQAQASKPITEIQERFYSALKECGEIFILFFKLYYDRYTAKEYAIEDNENKTMNKAVFAGDKYVNENFLVNCEITKGTNYSDATSITILKELLDKQIIDAKTYIRYLPNGIFAEKEEILKVLDEQEQSQLVQLQQTLIKEQQKGQALLQQMQQYSEVIKQLQSKLDGADDIIRENRQIKEMLVKLQAEYASKIGVANKKIENQNALIIQSGLEEYLKGGDENELSEMQQGADAT